ncbi:MAG TPA: hypothetical protein PKD64_05010 [Pirellulaceae bacterium]|nr:hypothetical protein [Pirellulaceae bacterium]HMO91535.1 hypothetical protein [Pirellulaceae bacterium]HMP68232.1 hypothetical protein [Pirellulaceae bacterium]
MLDSEYSLLIYLNMARVAKQQLKMPEHSRWKLLAVVTAHNLSLGPLANYCRQQILNNNPGHILGRFPSIEEALLNADFMYFMGQTRRSYSIENAEAELEKRQIDYQQDLIDAGDVENYLSKLLGVEYTWVLEHF